jgi:hypothetical protein
MGPTSEVPDPFARCLFFVIQAITIKIIITMKIKHAMTMPTIASVDK